MASTRFIMLLAAVVASAVTSCSQAVAPSPAATSVVQSILVDSSPAEGSTVSGEVENLVLHFEPAARLDEVMVSGPQGSMPMMVSSAGETKRYSLPLSGIGPGSYIVNWRATAQGREFSGSFQFKVTD